MSLIDNKKNHLSSPDKPAADKKLFDPVSFKALLNIQAEIAQETGWQPALSKLANALVNRDTLAYLKEIMLLEFKNRAVSKTEKGEKSADHKPQSID